jgi:phosphoglycerate dehydrogenase-like enzyme
MSELFGQTVGFVGFGDIAQSTAVLCKAFGMRIIALRNSRGQSGDELADSVFYSSEDTEAGAGRREVFRQADHIICSLPGTPSTKHACGREEFAAMKPTGIFVSIGRGLCVDEAALAEVLKAKRIAGAALDVFEKEPLPLDSPLWDCETLLFSAHNADLTAQYMRLTWDLFIAKLTEYSAEGFAGFASLVDKTKGY